MSRYNSSLCVLALQIYNIIVISEPHNHPQMKCWLFLFFFPTAGWRLMSIFIPPPRHKSVQDRPLTCQHTDYFLESAVTVRLRRPWKPWTWCPKTAWWWNTVLQENSGGTFLFFWQKKEEEINFTVQKQRLYSQVTGDKRGQIRDFAENNAFLIFKDLQHCTKYKRRNTVDLCDSLECGPPYQRAVS